MTETAAAPPVAVSDRLHEARAVLIEMWRDLIHAHAPQSSLEGVEKVVRITDYAIAQLEQEAR